MFRSVRPVWVLAVAAGLIAPATAAADAMTADENDVLAYSGGTLIGPATDAAGQFAGNDKGAQGTLLTKLNDENLFGTGLTNWSLAGSSDEGGGPFTGNPNSTSGDLFLDTPIDGPFVIALKGGNGYSAYYFDNMFEDIDQLKFTTAGLENGGGNNPALSHASLYVSLTTTSTGTTGTTSHTTGTTSHTTGTTSHTTGTTADATLGPTVGEAVPEPFTLALWGGLGGTLYLYRRHRKAANAEAGTGGANC